MKEVGSPDRTVVGGFSYPPFPPCLLEKRESHREHHAEAQCGEREPEPEGNGPDNGAQTALDFCDFVQVLAFIVLIILLVIVLVLLLVLVHVFVFAFIIVMIFSVVRRVPIRGIAHKGGGLRFEI